MKKQGKKSMEKKSKAAPSGKVAADRGPISVEDTGESLVVRVEGEAYAGLREVLADSRVADARASAALSLLAIARQLLAELVADESLAPLPDYGE
jgi:hypothetical protein